MVFLHCRIEPLTKSEIEKRESIVPHHTNIGAFPALDIRFLNKERKFLFTAASTSART
jgi:hypothetical protein